MGDGLAIEVRRQRGVVIMAVEGQIGVPAL
jgi:hypothetical protein